MSAALLLTPAVFVAATAAPAAAIGTCDSPDDPTRGFTVLVQGDASLGGSEVEGTVGVGGALSWDSTFDVRHSTGLTPPDYDLPEIDGLPVRVAAGAYDLAGSSGVLQVGSEADDAAWPRGEMIAGDDTWTGSALQGSEVFLGNGTDTYARVLSPNPPAATDLLDAWVAAHIGPMDVSQVTSGFPELDEIADLANRLTGSTDGVSEVSLAGGPSEKQLTLVAGDVNVLSLTPEQLEGTSAVSFTGAVPGAGTFLVIRMSGGTEFSIPRFNGANDSGSNNVFAPYVLWTYADPGPLTLDTQDRMTGSILAPRADLTLNNSSPVEGQIVAASLEKPGGTGEVHHYAFAGCIPDDLPAVGNVSISKTLDVDGTFTSLPVDVKIAYWVDGVRQLPDLFLPVDGTQLGPVAAPAGTVVELGEPTPAAIAGGEWEDPVWSVTGATTIPPTENGAQVAFVVGEDDDISVALTNTLTGLGQFTVQKSVDDAGLGSPDTFAFEWWVNGVQQSPNLQVEADGTVLGPVVVAGGAVVELREVAPADPAGGTWQDPTWSVTGASTATAQHGGYAFTADRGSAVAAVHVTNVVEPDPVVVTGGFAVAKVVAGPTDALPSSGTEFTGTWSCDAANGDGDSSGTWSVAAGGTVAFDGFPVGTACTVVEDADQAGGDHTVAYAPTSGRVVVAEGDPADVGLVTVTNTYAAVTPDDDGTPTPGDDGTPTPGDLATTGTDAAPIALAGALALLLGSALVVVVRRRTARSDR